MGRCQGPIRGPRAAWCKHGLMAGGAVRLPGVDATLSGAATRNDQGAPHPPAAAPLPTPQARTAAPPRAAADGGGAEAGGKPARARAGAGLPGSAALAAGAVVDRLVNADVALEAEQPAAQLAAQHHAGALVRAAVLAFRVRHERLQAAVAAERRGTLLPGRAEERGLRLRRR
jgi:hypothetical protein